MAHIMSKRGTEDNEVTYEFFCDETSDLQNIDPNYITLGSVAIVVNGFEAYIANSQKQWISLNTTPAVQEEQEEP